MNTLILFAMGNLMLFDIVRNIYLLSLNSPITILCHLYRCSDFDYDMIIEYLAECNAWIQWIVSYFVSGNLQYDCSKIWKLLETCAIHDFLTKQKFKRHFWTRNMSKLRTEETFIIMYICCKSFCRTANAQF